MRNVSDNGVLFTSLWEQFAPHPYRATAAEQYFTIGYGHYGPDVRAQWVINEARARELLKQDMAVAVQAVDNIAHQSLTQAQFDAVVDLVFNAGAGVIKPTTGTGAALRDGDIETLRQKLSLFINQNGKPVLGLKRRTAGRLALFDGKTATEAEAIGRAVKG